MWISYRRIHSDWLYFYPFRKRVRHVHPLLPNVPPPAFTTSGVMLFRSCSFLGACSAPTLSTSALNLSVGCQMFWQRDG